MSTITVTAPRATTPPSTLAAGVSFGGTNVVVKDNAGNVLPGVILTGKESPAWTAVFTGTDGPNEAQATLQDIDTKGNPLGSPVVLTETGTGGMPQTFQPVAGGTITVTG